MTLKRAAATVTILNLAFFVVEFGIAQAIESVSLLADSIDFLEDGSVNALVVVGLGWSAKARAQLGKVLSGVLLVPSVWALISIVLKLIAKTPPHASTLTMTGAAALAVNAYCAVLLARFRRGGSLAKVAFLSARNDAIANIAIIAAGIATTFWLSMWPDLFVGIGIAALNAGAAREVWITAHKESS